MKEDQVELITQQTKTCELDLDKRSFLERKLFLKILNLVGRISIKGKPRYLQYNQLGHL